MPIPGIGKRGFVELGRIHKGAEKSENGQFGRDLDYFRVSFKGGSEDQKELFRSVYGEQPAEINIRLPFNDLDRCWSYEYECYRKGGMVAAASGTDETGLLWKYFVDPDTDEVLIKNFMPLDIRGEDLVKDGVDIEKPIYSYKNRKQKMVPVFMEPYGRLRVVIPDLLTFGFFTLVTKSIYDINSLTDELMGVEQKAIETGKILSHIPLKLFRRWENQSVRIKGRRTKKDLSLCHIMIDLGWAEKALAYLEKESVPIIRLPSSTGAVNIPIVNAEPVFDEQEHVDEFRMNEEKSDQCVAESSELDITPLMVINEGFVDNAPHAKALLSLLEIPHQGYPASAGMERIQLYYKWRKMYSGKNADDRQSAAQHAIKGEEPIKLL